MLLVRSFVRFFYSTWLKVVSLFVSAMSTNHLLSQVRFLTPFFANLALRFLNLRFGKVTQPEIWISKREKYENPWLVSAGL